MAGIVACASAGAEACAMAPDSRRRLHSPVCRDPTRKACGSGAGIRATPGVLLGAAGSGGGG